MILMRIVAKMEEYYLLDRKDYEKLCKHYRLANPLSICDDAGHYARSKGVKFNYSEISDYVLNRTIIMNPQLW